MSEKKAKKKRKVNGEIKLKNEVFRDGAFMSGLSIINGAPLPLSLSLKLDDMVEAVEVHSKKFNRLRIKLLEECGFDKGPNGSFDLKKVNEKDTPKEIEEKFEKDFEELCEVEFVVKHEKIKIPSTSKLEIPSGCVRAVKPLFDFT